MGFRRITKSVTSLWVEARNVSANRYLKIYFSKDGGDWFHWDDIKTNGMVELDFPGGKPTYECNYTQIRVDFYTEDSSQSPILESLTARFIMRPDTRSGYSFRIIGATTYENEGSEDGRTAAEIITDLRETRDSKAPVEFRGLLGENIRGYLTSNLESPDWRSAQTESGELDIEYGIQCSFVEMENASKEE